MLIVPKNISNKKLRKIWAQVPVDYYDEGIRKNYLQKLWHGKKILNVTKLLPNNKPRVKYNILDVGCSSGILTNEVAKYIPTSKVFGVDSYGAVIRYAKKKYKNITFSENDAQNLPFKDKYFDIIICTETLEHVTDPKRVLLEIRRVLKDNGKAIISMDTGSRLFRIIWYYWVKTKGKVWNNAHLHDFNAAILENMIKNVGFSIKQKNKTHFGMSITFLANKK